MLNTKPTLFAVGKRAGVALVKKITRKSRWGYFSIDTSDRHLSEFLSVYEPNLKTKFLLKTCGNCQNWPCSRMRDVCVWFKWKVFVAHFVPRFTILSLNVATDKKDKTAVPKTQISHNRK